MNRTLIYLFLLLIVLGAAALALEAKKYAIVDIKGEKIIVKLARNSRERETGLSRRDKLCGRCGMLFVFPKQGRYSFWMKDMKFDLDIIWLSGGKINHIEKNVSRESMDLLNPPGISDKVLEINSGQSEKYGFQEGDAARIVGLFGKV